ncbi:MAG: hypothetical protein ACFN24_00600 [Candidatus Nanogingivalis sp.]
MADLVFTKENVEKLLLEAGFSDIESRSFVSFEEPNAFRTEAFLYKKSSREIYILIECLGDELAIYMRNNINLKILKNRRYTILTIENGKIDERNDFELNNFKSKSIFHEANRKLTNFISNLKKITLQ